MTGGGAGRTLVALVMEAAFLLVLGAFSVESTVLTATVGVGCRVTPLALRHHVVSGAPRSSPNPSPVVGDMPPGLAPLALGFLLFSHCWSVFSMIGISRVSLVVVQLSSVP